MYILIYIYICMYIYIKLTNNVSIRCFNMFKHCLNRLDHADLISWKIMINVLNQFPKPSPKSLCWWVGFQPSPNRSCSLPHINPLVLVWSVRSHMVSENHLKLYPIKIPPWYSHEISGNHRMRNMVHISGIHHFGCEIPWNPIEIPGLVTFT